MACQGMLITGMVFLCGGALFEFLALFTDFWKWVTLEGPFFGIDVFIHFGLFSVCVQRGGENTECEIMDDPEGHVLGTRYLIGIALGLSGLAILMSFFHSYNVSKRSASKGMVYGIDFLSSIAAFFLVVANIIYGTNYRDGDQWYKDEFDLGTSFYLNIVAAIGIIIGGILIQQSYNPEQTHPGGAVIVHAYPTAQPIPGPSAQVMLPTYGQSAYGQPAWGQPPAYGQPQLYMTAASGQPMPQGYSQQLYPTEQPGLSSNYNTQYGEKNAVSQDPNNPPPQAALY